MALNFLKSPFPKFYFKIFVDDNLLFDGFLATNFTSLSYSGTLSSSGISFLVDS